MQSFFSTKPERIIEIDNPGKGNCAFNAFSIALIPHLKSSLIKESKNEIFEKIIPYLSDKVKVSDFKNYIIQFNLQNPDKDLLKLFNSIFRKILADTRIRLIQQALDQKSYQDKLRHFSILDLYGDILGVFKCYYNWNESKIDEYNNDVIRDVNLKNELLQCAARLEGLHYKALPTPDSKPLLLAKSKKFRIEQEVASLETRLKLKPNEAKEIDIYLKEWKSEQIKKNDTLKELELKLKASHEKYAERDNLSKAFVLASMLSTRPQAERVLFKAIDEKKSETQITELLLEDLKFDKNSYLANLINKKRKNGEWGNESDLNCLASHGLSRDHKNPDILVEIHNEGEKIYLRRNENRIVIKVNNHGNNHWTTLFSMAEIQTDSKNKPAEQKKPQEIIIDTYTVIDILNQYQGSGGASRLFSGRWNRKNTKLAKEIISLLTEINNDRTKSKNITVSDLQEIILVSCRNLKINYLNPKGLFVQCIEQIFEMLCKDNHTQEVNKLLSAINALQPPQSEQTDLLGSMLQFFPFM